MTWIMLSTEILADLFNLLIFYFHIELISQMEPRGSKIIDNTFVLF